MKLWLKFDILIVPMID